MMYRRSGAVMYIMPKCVDKGCLKLEGEALRCQWSERCGRETLVLYCRFSSSFGLRCCLIYGKQVRSKGIDIDLLNTHLIHGEIHSPVGQLRY